MSVMRRVQHGAAQGAALAAGFLLGNFYGNSDRNPIKQLDHIGIAHADAAMRTGHPHRHTIWGAMDINIAAHGIDVAQPVKSDFTSRKPEDPGQNPVPAGIFRCQFRGVSLPCGPPSNKNRVFRGPGADPHTHDVAAQRGALATVFLACAVTCRRDRVTMQNVSLIIN